jgi:hypothetical protein
MMQTMMQVTILVQMMMHATMLIQAIMQAIGDGGVCDKWSLTIFFHHYAPNWVFPIPQLMVFIDVYAVRP